jgi:hypothetical protein
VFLLLLIADHGIYPKAFSSLGYAYYETNKMQEDKTACEKTSPQLSFRFCFYLDVTRWIQELPGGENLINRSRAPKF